MNAEIDQLFSVAEVCRLTSYEKSTVYDRIKTGRLKAFRLDGQIQIRRADLEGYLAAASKPLSHASAA